MSGPITPPLTVTEIDGSPSGRPITTIKVSNGDLTISGNTATIDTTGSSTTPGGSNTEVQYNNSGSFGGDSGFTFNRSTNVATITGGAVLADLNIGDTAATAIRAVNNNDNLYFAPEGTGTLTLQNHDSAGGTLADAKFIMMRNANTDEAIFQFQDATTSHQVTLTQVSGSNFEIQNREDDKNIKIITGGTGILEVTNATTNNNATFTVSGNGTGDAKINLGSPSKSILLICDTDEKLKIEGTKTFIFDASSAVGGITWPDGTTQTSAASGGGDSFPLGPDPADVGDGTQYQFTATQAAWGGIDSDQGWIAAFPILHPFIAQASGDLASISLHVRTAGAGTSGQFGIYSDNGGVPDSLMGYATIDLSSTGDVTQTTLSATISMTDYICDGRPRPNLGLKW